MPADRSFITHNDAELARLRAICSRLSDEDLRREIGDGWTATAMLAHLTFWDRRALVLLDRWEQHSVQASADDADAINDAALPQWRAIPPQEAVAQALAAADAVDSKLASISEQTIEAILALGNPINLDRGNHRAAHLDEIERALLR